MKMLDVAIQKSRTMTANELKAWYLSLSVEERQELDQQVAESRDAIVEVWSRFADNVKVAAKKVVQFAHDIGAVVIPD